MTDAPLDRSTPFSAAHPHFQIAWDSTSLGLLKECPRKYYYEIILGWRPRATSVHLIFGQAYHAALEHYDHHAASLGKLGGALSDEEHNVGIRIALRQAIEASGKRVKVQCSACGGGGKYRLAPEDPMSAFCDCELCGGTGSFGPPVWEPWRSDDPYKNVWTLARSVVTYLDHFRGSRLVTLELSDGRPAVELSFYFHAGEVDGITFGYCGHLDRVVRDPLDNDKKSVHDRKTTKGQLTRNFWQGFNPHNQFSLYTAASTLHFEQPTWGITVDAAQILVNSTTFERQFIPYPPALIDEWLAEAHTWVTIAARYAQAGHWPKNDRSCGNYGGCAFRKVCSKAPSFRQSWLESDFVHFRWNPLQIRGDV